MTLRDSLDGVAGLPLEPPEPPSKPCRDCWGHGSITVSCAGLYDEDEMEVERECARCCGCGREYAA